MHAVPAAAAAMASSSAPQPQLQPGSPGRRLRAVRVGLRPAVSSSPASDRAVHRAAGAAAGTAAMPIAPSRPALKERRFTSEAVEAAVVDIGGRMADEQLGCLFANTLPNTLDTTVYHHAAEPAGCCVVLPLYVIVCDVITHDSAQNF